MAMAGQKEIVRLFWRRLGMLALLFFVVAAGAAVWNVWHKEAESRALRHQAEVKLYDLREQEASLSNNIAKLKTDRGKEEALRAQYGVGKEGEALIVIVEPPTPEPIEKQPGMRDWVRKFLPFW